MQLVWFKRSKQCRNTPTIESIYFETVNLAKHHDATLRNFTSTSSLQLFTYLDIRLKKETTKTLER